MNGQVVLPTFFSLCLNLAIRSSWSGLHRWLSGKEFTCQYRRSSWSEPQSAPSLFCWLYRASPTLAAKNIIILISLLTIWWCPCVESSLLLLEEGVCYEQCVPLTELFSLLYFVLQGQGQICLLFQVSHNFLLLHSSSLWWKGHLFRVLVLEGLADLHRTVQLQLL